jgi:hypothetical protein
MRPLNDGLPPAIGHQALPVTRFTGMREEIQPFIFRMVGVGRTISVYAHPGFEKKGSLSPYPEDGNLTHLEQQISGAKGTLCSRFGFSRRISRQNLGDSQGGVISGAGNLV